MSFLDQSPQAGTILLIDEQPESQSQIAGFLQQAGYQVHIEHSAQGGLAYWRTHEPAVICCEVVLAGPGGLAVLQEINSSDGDSKVIMVSEVSEMELVVEALRLGATDYLLKPFSDLAVLKHAVNRAFEQHQLQRENRLYREELEAKNKELANSLRLLKEDQEAGRAVQLRMLPANQKQYDSVRIEYEIIPSLYLSGDFLDYFSLGQDRIGFYLADVSGHGASSAFVTVLLKTMANRVKRRFRSGEVTSNELMPSEVLKRANAELLPIGLGKHLAIFCGYIDLAARKLVYCSAAHFPPPILVTEGKAIALEGRGLPVGLFEEVQYKNQQVRLGEHFHLVVFSDGILEVMPQQTVAEKEHYLMEIVTKGIHNVSDLLDHLELRDKEAVPDDIALMTVSCSE